MDDLGKNQIFQKKTISIDYCFMLLLLSFQNHSSINKKNTVRWTTEVYQEDEQVLLSATTNLRKILSLGELKKQIKKKNS